MTRKTWGEEEGGRKKSCKLSIRSRESGRARCPFFMPRSSFRAGERENMKVDTFFSEPEHNAQGGDFGRPTQPVELVKEEDRGGKKKRPLSLYKNSPFLEVDLSYVVATLSPAFFSLSISCNKVVGCSNR